MGKLYIKERKLYVETDADVMNELSGIFDQIIAIWEYPDYAYR